MIYGVLLPLSILLMVIVRLIYIYGNDDMDIKWLSMALFWDVVSMAGIITTVLHIAGVLE